MTLLLLLLLLLLVRRSLPNSLLVFVFVHSLTLTMCFYFFLLSSSSISRPTLELCVIMNCGLLNTQVIYFHLFLVLWWHLHFTSLLLRAHASFCPCVSWTTWLQLRELTYQWFFVDPCRRIIWTVYKCEFNYFIQLEKRVLTFVKI